MKITLAVLFLAGLIYYCKCTPVLSISPSLIAQAASLEERLKHQIPETKTDSGGVLVGEDLQLQQQQQNGKQDGNIIATDLYKNFKNLWQKDLSLNLQKRERNTFEDQIADVGKQQSQQQATATIKNNNRISREHIIQPQQLQQQRDNEKNNINISKLPTGAVITNEATNLNIDTQPQQQFPSAAYELNEWLAPPSDPLTNDDFSNAPPFQTLFTTGQSKIFEPKNRAATDDDADAAIWNKYIKPLKYWTRQCKSDKENNCPQEYYRALIADRNNALLKQLQYKQNMQPPPLSTKKNPLTEFSIYGSQDSNVSPTLPLAYKNNNIHNDDIVLLLTAEQNLVQFLSWALAELYPFGKFSNQSVDGADFYHPGMYLWKKLNLSGRLEPPLLVDEPRYVIVRREYDQDDDDGSYQRGLNYGRDPFIPPRGRKHNLPDLDSLLQRYEPFVPNRGRRDRIKDIFKYDDLFYPNRGKRQMTAMPMSPEAIFNDVIDERNDDNANDKNVEQQFQRPLSTNEMTLEQIKNLMEKMKRKLQQNLNQQQKKVENSFDEMPRNQPTGMSTTFQQPQQQQQQQQPTLLMGKRFKSMFNVLQNLQNQNIPNNHHNNARRQWWKRYTAATTTNINNDRPASDGARSMVANRLQTLRSMSPLQQLTLQYQQKKLQQQYQKYQQPDYLSPALSKQAITKFMWPEQQQQQRQQKQWRQQQQPLKPLAQQFDPLSWHKLQMLQQQQYHLPLLTMRHPRLTALQHLPSIQKLRHLQLATPPETQLTNPADQIDNSVSNDFDNFSTRDLDFD